MNRELSSNNLPEAQCFFQISMIVTGVINVFHSVTEYLVRDVLPESSVIGVVAGFTLILAGYHSKKEARIPKMTLALVYLGVPILTYRILTMTGLGGSTAIWYMIFPLYTSLFNNRNATVFATLYTAIGFSVGFLTEAYYHDYFYKIHTTYPRALSANLTFITITGIASHLFCYHRQREKMERRIAEQQAMVIHASKMITVGEMAGSIAHEINTPLNAISMLAQSMEEKLAKRSIEPALVRKNLLKIAEIVHKVSRTTSALLNYSRMKNPRGAQATDIHEILEDIKFLCEQQLAKRGIKLEYHSELPADTLFTCRVNEVVQILVVLINNASDAIAELSEKWIRLKAYSFDNQVVFEIQDSGSGIPRHVAEKMFSPYFTTKAAGKGTGLGLSVAAQLARSHGGELSYIPENTNTTFRLLIPQQSNVGAA